MQPETGKEIGLIRQRTMPWNPTEVSMHFAIWGIDPNSSISVWSLVYPFIFTRTVDMVIVSCLFRRLIIPLTSMIPWSLKELQLKMESDMLIRKNPLLTQWLIYAISNTYNISITWRRDPGIFQGFFFGLFFISETIL